MLNLLLTLLVILVIVAVFYLILYLFQKYVMPLDQKIVGILIFILAAVLIVYALTGHDLVFWH